MLRRMAGRDYQWIELRPELPQAEAGRAGWAHSGVAISEQGEILTGHPAEATLLVLDRNGLLVRSAPTELTELHGLTLVREGDEQRLWVADIGRKRRPELGYEYDFDQDGGRVVQLDLDGRTVRALPRPDLPDYESAGYSPTSVAVDEERHGGSGDIWVADGYGASLVHRYDRTGRYLATLSGDQGAGRFSCPHAIHLDYRRGEAELYVADRSNSRIQVFDLDGRFKRVFGAEFLQGPSSFAGDGESLVLTDLNAACLVVLDREDQLVQRLFQNAAASSRSGWPNERGDDGPPRRPGDLGAGRLNSPHGLAADAEGSLYVSEWLIGGRYLKLVPR